MRKFYQLLFLLLLLCISFYYGYHKTLSYRPQSIHAWRQADCASIALNYYRNGMNFFKPQVHNLTSDGGTTGYSATSEIPVLYFSTALLYKIFGPHEIIIRLINMLIFFLGLFHLFKLLFLLLKDFFWASALSLLFFTSPVLVYYGNNFIGNVSGLSFSIIGFYYFTRYYFDSKRKFLILSFVLFFLAGAFKVTSLMVLIALFFYFILENLFFSKRILSIKIFNKKTFILGALLVFLLIGSWLLYAGYYNNIHQSYYFSTVLFPIWTLSFQEISDFVKHIWEAWSGEYFNISVHIFMLVLLTFIVFNLKKADRLHLIVLLGLIVESAGYILLQFWTFHDHDYYTIEQNIVPIFIIITAFGILGKHYSPIFKSPVLKGIFTIFLIFNIFYANSRVEERYNGWQNNYYNEKNDIYSITPYLREIGIEEDDKIIYIPDFTNVSLYLIDQPGWTQYTDKRLNRGIQIKYNQDNSGIAASISKGAKYLIVNDISDIYLNPYIKSFTHSLKGNYGSVLIFDLKDTLSNFSIDETKLKDSVYFELNKDLKINSKLPYGETLIFKDCEYGERFLVSVLRKGSDKGCIVAGGPAEAKFYLSNSKSSDSEEWKSLQMEFFIPRRMVGKELKIYLYNPSDEDAFFKDFIIKRYYMPMNISGISVIN